ncbi:MAG: hypothetical protein IKV00_07765 [Clostridia bacterium]|nr:hypothetical protein [Clostridia bacterium]
MKITKLMALALVLVMLVSAFAACGGETETETDLPATETQAPETDPPVAETEHEHEIEVDEKLSTCSERGYRIETCKTCGEVLAEEAYPKLTCTPNAEATCTEASVCTACGKELAAAKGHTFGDATVVDATCQADGKESKTCTVCGETVETVLPKIAHIMGEVTESKEATCSETGYNKGACIMCGETVTKELPAAHDYIMEAFRTAEDGSLLGTCYSCGDVAVTEEIRVALTFDVADLESEIASIANGDKLTLVDSTVSSVYKKANAVITANGDRSVLAPRRPVMIDFEDTLLTDASYYIVSFDYYITQNPPAEDPSNPKRATVFAFLPGFSGGGKVAGSGSFANFTKYTFGKGLVYSQYGTLASIDKGAVVMEIEAGKWYRFTYIIDNLAGEAYAYVDGTFIASPVMDEPGMFSVTPETSAANDGYFTMIFADDYVKNYGAQFDNFSISVIR